MIFLDILLVAERCPTHAWLVRADGGEARLANVRVKVVFPINHPPGPARPSPLNLVA
jgi:hypothetical protein